jgi:hypothetical protein
VKKRKKGGKQGSRERGEFTDLPGMTKRLSKTRTTLYKVDRTVRTPMVAATRTTATWDGDISSLQKQRPSGPS